MPKYKAGAFQITPRPADPGAQQAQIDALVAQRPATVADIPLGDIGPSPFQARKAFEDLEELTAAIRAQGFRSRLLVRPTVDKAVPYELAYGERRLRAAEQVGLVTVPCDIVELSDSEMYEIGLSENLQHKHLNALEEAESFHIGITQYGYTVRSLAEKVGKHRDYVEERLAVYRRAPEDVQAAVAAGTVSLRAAREIGKLEDADQRAALLAGFDAGTLNTADVRTLVQADPSPPLPPRRPHVAAPVPSPDPPYDDPTARPILIADTFGELRLSYPSEDLLRAAIAEMQHFYGDRVHLRAMRQPGRKGDWLAYGTLRARQPD